MASGRRKSNRPRKKIILRHTGMKCPFCEKSATPDYKDFEALKPFVTERGRLLGRVRTGVCQKHQRRLSVAVKRARHLARLPFVASLA
jgi:small subunit ribosomal protein S18